MEEPKLTATIELLVDMFISLTARNYNFNID
jgi:hypothetical protein